MSFITLSTIFMSISVFLILIIGLALVLCMAFILPKCLNNSINHIAEVTNHQLKLYLFTRYIMNANESENPIKVLENYIQIAFSEFVVMKTAENGKDFFINSELKQKMIEYTNEYILQRLSPMYIEMLSMYIHEDSVIAYIEHTVVMNAELYIADFNARPNKAFSMMSPNPSTSSSANKDDQKLVI